MKLLGDIATLRWKAKMNWDSSLKRRFKGLPSTRAADLERNEKGLKLRMLPSSRDESAEQPSKLEAENAELRRRAAELALEIHALRDR